MVVAARTACCGNDHVGKDDRHCRDVPLVLQQEGAHTPTHLAQGRRTQHTMRGQSMEPASTPPGVSVRVREETGQGLRCTKIKVAGQERKA